jgi:hypothetical protein
MGNAISTIDTGTTLALEDPVLSPEEAKKKKKKGRLEGLLRDRNWFEAEWELPFQGFFCSYDLQLLGFPCDLIWFYISTVVPSCPAENFLHN